MGLDPHVQGSSRSETRGLIAAIIDSFNETGNPPVALVQRAMAAAGIPWQNQHIRWKDDGTCVTAAPSPSAREPTPGTRANAPESIEHAHPPRPASPTPQDQRKRPREDVPALGDLPAAAPATKRKTNGPSDAVESQKKPLVVVSEEWSPDSDPRLGRIFRLRVDRDGNPRGDGVFAEDAYPLRWVRLVTTEHQLAIGNRPSGAYVACATEAKSWEAANEAFSRRESRGKESRGGRKRSSIVFYESLDLEFLESKHDVEYLDLHRYPHPGAASVPPGLADLAAVATADATADGKTPPAAPGSPERVARRASRHPPPPPFSNGRVFETECSKKGNSEGPADRVAPEPRGYDDDVRTDPTDPKKIKKNPGPKPDTIADPLREEVRALRARLERVARRLRAEREERRLNETRMAAALRETRRALERAVAERDTPPLGA